MIKLYVNHTEGLHGSFGSVTLLRVKAVLAGLASLEMVERL